MRAGLNRVLNAAMGAFVGALIGRGAYLYWAYRARPGLYAAQSAPWYARLVPGAVVTLLVVCACACVKLALRAGRRR